MYTTPLLPWLQKQESGPVFDRRTAQCERGYIGCWRIHQDKLWLVSLHAWRNGKYSGVSDWFDDRPVAAEWFSGPLVVEPASFEIDQGALPVLSTLLIEHGRVMAYGDEKTFRR